MLARCFAQNREGSTAVPNIFLEAGAFFGQINFRKFFLKTIFFFKNDEAIFLKAKCDLLISSIVVF